MSRCSAMVFTVSGRVGLVDDGSMPASGPLRVIGVNGSAGDGRDSMVHEAGFIQRVGVNGNLNVIGVRHAQARVDRSGCGSPILVQLEPARLGRPEHLLQVPAAWRASGGVGSRGGTGSTADHGGGAVRKRFVNLLRRNEVDVRVNGARGYDLAFASDHLGGRANHQIRIHSVLRIRVTRFADLHDAAVANTDVPLDDAPVIDDQRVGDHQVESALLGFAFRCGALAHAVADHLATAKSYFIAVDGEVFLYFDDEFRIRQANAVARGRAIKVGISAAGNSCAHAAGSGPFALRGRFTTPLWPYTDLAPPSATSGTSFSSPGSKRIAVPAGMSNRKP